MNALQEKILRRSGLDNKARGRIRNALEKSSLFFENLKAKAAGNAALLETNSALKGTITDLESTIAALRAENSELTQLRETVKTLSGGADLAQMIAGLQKETAEIPLLRETIKQLSSHASTVSAAAIDQIAALGFPASQLPAASSSENGNDGEPSTPMDFMTQHAKLAAEDPSKAAAFFSKHARKFGL